MDELKVYNENGILVTKPFIFTSSGSFDFYADSSKIEVVETKQLPADDRRKTFSFRLTKDENRNYELYIRVNPSRMLETVASVVTLGTSIKSLFSWSLKESD